MTLLEQWQAQKRLIEAMLSAGHLDPQAAAKALARLDYRIKRRPLILKRRRDRKAWREVQAERRHERTESNDTP